MADFEYQWLRKQAELERQLAVGAIDSVEELRLLGVHDLEEEKALAVALSPEEFRAWQKESMLADMDLGRVALSPAESDRLFGLRLDLQSRRRQLEQTQRDGLISPSELDSQVSGLESAYQGQFAQLLGGRVDQLADANDGVAHEVRDRLGKTPITREQLGQLEDIARARRQMTAEAMGGPGSTENASAREASIQQLADQLARAALNNEH